MVYRTWKLNTFDIHCGGLDAGNKINQESASPSSLLNSHVYNFVVYFPRFVNTQFWNALTISGGIPTLFCLRIGNWEPFDQQIDDVKDFQEPCSVVQGTLNLGQNPTKWKIQLLF